MKINTISTNYNTPGFGAKLNGKLTFDLSTELFARKLGKYGQAYDAHCKKLASAGSETSELYLSKNGGGTIGFNLKNPSITTAYEIPMGEAEPGHLLETFFKIKPEDIIKAEEKMKSLINEKISGLIKAAQSDKNVYNTVTKAGKDSNVEKAVKNLDDNTIIDLYYSTKK